MNRFGAENRQFRGLKKQINNFFFKKVLKKNILFVHGAKCSGTEQNVLVRVPNVLACNIPPTKCLHKISHPFLSIFTAIIVSTKSLPPPPKHMVGTGWGELSLGGRGRKFADGCRATFSLRPNSSESEKAWSSFNL